MLEHVCTVKLASLYRSILTRLLDFMNDLQHIPEEDFGPVLVTLNPPVEPDVRKTVGWYKYDHPVLDSAVRQRRPAFLVIWQAC